METQYVGIRREALETFCQQVFQSLGLSEQDARTAAAVLVAADEERAFVLDMSTTVVTSST